MEDKNHEAAASQQGSGAEDDRRAFPRRLAHGTVVCRLGHRGLGNEIRGKVFDLSPGGIGLVLPCAVDTGLEVELELAGIGSSKSFKAEGVVRLCFPVDSKNFRVGIRFERRINYDQLASLTY